MCTLAFINVNMIEKIFVHEGYIALCSGWLHGVVLVQVKGDYVFKAKAFFFVWRTSSA
jgi:hypothetical protein